MHHESNLRCLGARLHHPVVIGALGCCCTVLGTAVLAGWVLHVPLLSWSAAMPNAAVGFALDGLALVTLAWGRSRLALAGAAWSFLLGSATLAEYLFSVDLHIDQALIRADYGRSVFPGRIGPNVAFNFVIVGVVLWWASACTRQWKWVGAMGLLSAVVFGTGAASAIAHLAGRPSPDPWSELLPRIGALDAALGFALLGSGLLLVVWWRGRQQEAGFSAWLTVSIVSGGLVVALCFGHALTGLSADRTAEVARQVGWAPEEVTAVLRVAQGSLPLMLAGIGSLVTLLLVLMANQTLASRHQAVKLRAEIAERKVVQEALARQAAELERSNTELRNFAYIASHDLQEPLRPIASFSQLLAKRYRGQLDADADEFIDYLVQGAVRMQALINGLLAYSRLDTRAAALGPTDCEVVLKEALDNLETAARQAHAEITHDSLPAVLADSAQLRQVFQNLISNALKFHGPEPPRVHVAAEWTPGAWRFSVQDNGIGIDGQFADQIFVIFRRLHPHSQYPGIGVGLALCKKIVERHGGKIWVESQPGQGSTFFFSIPAVPEDIAVHDPPGGGDAQQPVTPAEVRQ